MCGVGKNERNLKKVLIRLIAGGVNAISVKHFFHAHLYYMVYIDDAK